MAHIKKPSFAIIRYPGKTLSNGENPLMIRVTYDRKQKYFSLGMSAAAEDWNDTLAKFEPKDPVTGKGKRLTEQQRENNARLGNKSEKLKQIAKDFEDMVFSFDQFRKLALKVGLFQGSAHSGSVFTFTQRVIDDLMSEERIGSALSYKDTLNRVKAFRKNKDFSFRDIDDEFIEDFKKHLRKTNSINSIGIYLRTLKAIYNRAIKKGLVKEDLSPWKGLHIETAKTRKRALTRQQLDALKSYKAEKGSPAWHALNYFMFSYYCRGMNFADLARLTADNIQNGRIFYKREKTGDDFDIAIEERLAEILLHYSGNDTFLFPILSPGMKPLTIKQRLKTRLKKINKELQDIAAAINAMPESKIAEITIPKDITFYWARHTAATMLKRAKVSTAMISEILGHSSELVTKTYLASFGKDELDEAGKHL